MEDMKPYAPFTEMLNSIPDNEKAEMRSTYYNTRNLLQKTFPRGRFNMAEDGRAVLVSRRKSLADWQVYHYGPGKIAVYYPKWSVLLDEIPKELVLKSDKHDSDGVMVLKADPSLPQYLRCFQKGLQGQSRGPRGVGSIQMTRA